MSLRRSASQELSSSSQGVLFTARSDNASTVDNPQDMYAVVHTEVNEFINPIEHHIRFFPTYEAALSAVFSMWPRESWDYLDSLEKERPDEFKILEERYKAALKKGAGVWCYTWQRRGHGFGFRIVKCKGYEFSYSPNFGGNDSVVINERLGGD